MFHPLGPSYTEPLPSESSAWRHHESLSIVNSVDNCASTAGDSSPAFFYFRGRNPRLPRKGAAVLRPYDPTLTTSRIERKAAGTLSRYAQSKPHSKRQNHRPKGRPPQRRAEARPKQSTNVEQATDIRNHRRHGEAAWAGAIAVGIREALRNTQVLGAAIIC